MLQREKRPPEPSEADEPVTSERERRPGLRAAFIPSRRAIQPILILLFFGLVTCLFFSKILFSPDRYHIPYDIGDYHYPLAHQLYEGLRTWELPLWDPCPYAGMPLAGNINAQVFYPPTLVIVKVSDWLLGSFPYRVLEYQLILHYLLAALGAYLLARSFRLTRTASLMCGLVFAFGGFFASQMQHLGLINGAAWIPLIFYFLKKSIESSRIRHAIPGGIALAMAILAGFPALFMLTLLTLGFTTLAVAVGFIVDRDYRKAGFTVLTLALMVAISLGLSAIQLFPAAELNAVSVAAEQHEGAGIGGIPPEAYFTLLFPRAWGVGTTKYWAGTDMTLMYLYVGITPLVLAALCLLAPGRRRVFLIFGMTLFCFVWAMGQVFPLAEWIWFLLPESFRGGLYNFYAKVFFDLGIAILGAFGLHRLCAPEFREGFGRSARRLVNFLGFLAGGLLVISMMVLIAAAGTEFGTAIRGRLIEMGQGIHLLMLSLVLISLAIFWRLSGRIGANSAAAALILFAVLELVGFGAGTAFNTYHGSSTNVSPDSLNGDPQPIRLIRSDVDFRANRHMRVDVISRGGRAWHTMCRVWGIENANGDDPLLLQEFYSLRMLDSTTDGLRRFIANDPASPLLDLLGVKYMVVYEGNPFTPPPGFQLKLPGAVMIYERPSFLPRAFFTPGAEFSDRASILLRMQRRTFSADVALLEGSPRSVGLVDTAPDQATVSQTQVQILSHRPNVVRIAAAVPRAGFVVLTDAFCPGWTAEVDGKETDIYKAYGALRAVALPAGKHEVVFKYRPRSVLIGGFITALTALGIGIAAILLLRKARAERAPL